METASYHPLRSLLLAQAIQAEALRSWRNAALAVAHFPDLFAGGAYVEGWLILPKATTIAIVESGWCRTAESLILDPTIVLREQADQPVAYFAGFEIATEQLVQQTQGQVLPLVCNSAYGRDGMKHPGYKDAFEQARQQAHTLAREKHLSPEAIQVYGRDAHRRGITLVME